MPQRNWNNLPDLLRAMPVKVSVKDGKFALQCSLCFYKLSYFSQRVVF